jgi:hypothetical protein
MSGNTFKAIRTVMRAATASLSTLAVAAVEEA